MTKSFPPGNQPHIKAGAEYEIPCQARNGVFVSCRVYCVAVAATAEQGPNKFGAKDGVYILEVYS